MNMSGELDPLYGVARQVLFDGLEALDVHREAIVLVGAQAVYLHTGDIDLAVAPFTIDADVALNPRIIEPLPLLEELMISSGFRHGSQPGIWLKTREVGDRSIDVTLDLLVPDSLGGEGRRGARLTSHGSNVARKARGLEATLVDNVLLEISSFESRDVRSYHVRVAGPSALLVAKLHKLGERENTPGRLKAKDALDVFRLLRGVSTQDFVDGFGKLRADDLSTTVTSEAIQYLGRLFGRADAVGSRLVAEAAGSDPGDRAEND